MWWPCSVPGSPLPCLQAPELWCLSFPATWSMGQPRSGPVGSPVGWVLRMCILGRKAGPVAEWEVAGPRLQELVLRWTLLGWALTPLPGSSQVADAGATQGPPWRQDSPRNAAPAASRGTPTPRSTSSSSGASSSSRAPSTSW